MKKCKACGAVQKDERTTCIDCGKILGEPMSAAEAEAIEDALDDKLYSMTERTDDFHVPLWHKVLAGVLAVCIVAAAIMIKLDKNSAGMSALIGLAASIFAIPMLLFPKILWHLGTLRYRLWFDSSELSPSYFSVVMGKLITYLSSAVGIIGTVYAYFVYLT